VGTLKKEALSFVLVGIASTFWNFLVFLLFLKIYMFHYLTSSTLGFISGVLLGYFLNSKWTFIGTNSHNLKTFIKYVIVYFCSLLVGLLIMNLLVEYFLMNKLLANCFTICFTTLTNFIGLKKIVFIKP